MELLQRHEDGRVDYHPDFVAELSAEQDTITEQPKRCVSPNLSSASFSGRSNNTTMAGRSIERLSDDTIGERSRRTQAPQRSRRRIC
jgi:hypothetical protein